MVSVTGSLSLLLFVSSVSYATSAPDSKFVTSTGILIEGEVSQEQVDKCLDKTGLKKDEMHVLMEPSDAELSEKHWCFMKCMGTIVGGINEDGSLNMEYLKNHLSPTAQHDSATLIPCLETVGMITQCKDVEKLRKCFPKIPTQ